MSYDCSLHSLARTHLRAIYDMLYKRSTRTRRISQRQSLWTVASKKDLSVSLNSRFCDHFEMGKLVLFFFVALLTTTLISAASTNCGRHGDPCVSDSQCCGTIKCHRYANRCQVQITAEELMAQREKILGRKGKDY